MTSSCSFTFSILSSNGRKKGRVERVWRFHCADVRFELTMPRRGGRDDRTWRKGEVRAVRQDKVTRDADVRM